MFFSEFHESVNVEQLDILSEKLRKDISLFYDMKAFLSSDLSCQESIGRMSKILKKLGPPISFELYNAVKVLMQRIVSAIVDKESIEILMDLMKDCLNGDLDISENYSLESTSERALKLLNLLAYMFPGKFQRESILQRLIDMLKDNEYAAPYVLKAFTYLGRYKPLIEVHIKLISELAPICKKFVIYGTPEQARNATVCMHTNAMHSYCEELSTLLNLDIFPDIMESFKTSLVPDHERYRAAIVSLGLIAYLMPNRFKIQIKTAITRIVKDLILDKDDSAASQLPIEWCDEVNLPEKTRCKIAGLKTLARWFLSSEQNESSEKRTSRLLSEIIE